MPLSSAVFKSEHRNPVPQCPPRLDVQTINSVLWSRMPNCFLKVDTARVSDRHGWAVQCVEPLQMLAVHIPEENRWECIHTEAYTHTHTRTHTHKYLHSLTHQL